MADIKDTKISEAVLFVGVDSASVLPANMAQIGYGGVASQDLDNYRLPISVPGNTSPQTISLGALQVLGQTCVCVGEDILNPVWDDELNQFFSDTLKNVIVYSMTSGGNIMNWAPAWMTWPPSTNARGIPKMLLCYTINGVMVTINTVTRAVTKRNILPSMGVGPDVEVGSGLLSAPSLEFEGMTNHFDVGDTIRKDNGDGTASFYRLNGVTTDSEGNKTAKWESLSVFKPNEVTTLAGLPIDKYGIKVTVTQATSMSFAITPDEGMEYILDILNNTSADIEQPLPNGDNWQVPKDSITLVAGKVTEISVRYVFGKYVVKV